MKVKNQTKVSPYVFAGLGETNQMRVRTGRAPSTYTDRNRLKHQRDWRNNLEFYETVGYDRNDRIVCSEADKNKWLSNVMKFILIYLNNSELNEQSLFSNKRYQYITDLKRLFSFAASMNIHHHISLIAIGQFMNRDHSTVIYARDRQIGFNDSYPEDKRRSDYIMRFANSKVKHVLNYEFNETNIELIRNGEFKGESCS